MQIFRDWEGRRIRLTEERLKHILEHPEMKNMIHAIEDALSSPEKIVQSLTDSQTRMYFRFYFGTMVGDKYLCVVVKIKSSDAFILTAYLTDKIKKGVLIWPKRI